MKRIWIGIQDELVRYLVLCSHQSYKSYQILLAALFGSSLELGVIPYLLIVMGKWLDNVFAIRPLLVKEDALVLGVLAVFIGLPWMFWSIYTQHTRGRGTPFPLIPTKTLLNEGPYKYTRNPMAFGAIFWLAGWALIFNSPMALFIGVSTFAVVVFTYIKTVEEKELKQRFGEPYVDYILSTPFLIPDILGKLRRKS